MGLNLGLVLDVADICYHLCLMILPDPQQSRPILPNDVVF